MSKVGKMSYHTLYKEVDEELDNLYNLLAQKYELVSGDITLTQEVEKEKFRNSLINWIVQNRE